MPLKENLVQLMDGPLDGEIIDTNADVVSILMYRDTWKHGVFWTSQPNGSAVSCARYKKSSNPRKYFYTRGK